MSVSACTIYCSLTSVRNWMIWSEQTSYIAFRSVASSFTASSGAEKKFAVTVMWLMLSSGLTLKGSIRAIHSYGSTLERGICFFDIADLGGKFAVHFSPHTVQSQPRTAQYREVPVRKAGVMRGLERIGRQLANLLLWVQQHMRLQALGALLRDLSRQFLRKDKITEKMSAYSAYFVFPSWFPPSIYSSQLGMTRWKRSNNG